LKSYAQYPIVNANAPSYIFYDRIAGLEGIYKKEDFYFKIDPFMFENIDHYSVEDMNLSGEFLRKHPETNAAVSYNQENNSLAFK
jgi:hypothetical protein